MNIINLKENKIKIVLDFSEIDFFFKNSSSILKNNYSTKSNSFFLIEKFFWLEHSFTIIISIHSYSNFHSFNKALLSNISTYIFTISTLTQFTNFIKLLRTKNNKSLVLLSKYISLHLYNNNYFIFLEIPEKDSIYFNHFISILFEMFPFISSSKSLENLIKKEGKLLFENNTVIFPSQNNKKGE